MDVQQELTARVEEALSILRAHGVSQFQAWFAQDLADLKKGEVVRAARHLLGAYGGMGSLNDVVICVENGHRVAPEEVDQVNGRFLEAIGRIRALAEAVLKGHP